MGIKSKNEGAGWESIIEFRARSQGILPIKMPIGARRIGRNRLIQIKTPFDMTLVYKGVTVFIDAKSFDSDRITYSQLTDHQIHMLSRIEEQQCVAGYLIYFRKENAVCFAKASWLAAIKPGDSMRGDHMILLGQLEDFTLGRLFSLQWEQP